MRNLLLAFALVASFTSGCASKSQAKNDRQLVESMLIDLQKVESESLTPVVASTDTQGDNR